LAWENEALLAVNKLSKGEFDIVVPSISILAEPPVTVVNGNVEKKGAAAVEAAEAYLEYLYSPVAQKLAAKHYYRPVFGHFANKEDLKRFPNVTRVTVQDVFGGWQKAQKTHFNDGGVFDAIYLPQ
ncbi:MAG TPA: sulfate ABC transporter substrate-binding protein, partial [Marinobacter sp.]|nr:sulfate ABC transporter substrate-binding protein [Marinobacter sp.]